MPWKSGTSTYAAPDSTGDGQIVEAGQVDPEVGPAGVVRSIEAGAGQRTRDTPPARVEQLRADVGVMKLYHQSGE